MNKSLTRLKINDIAMIGMFAAVICVLAIISIPIGTIPFSLGVFAILLTGALLPPYHAVIAVVIYLLLGSIGLPVFAKFQSGFQTLFGSTGGYLMAYPITAYIVAKSKEIHNNKFKEEYEWITLSIGMILGTLICYLLGTLWFSYISHNTFARSLSLCVIPFIPVDIIKIILAILVSKIIEKVIPNTL